VYEEGQANSLVVGSEQWFEWLRKDTSTIFSVHTLNGSYTARKERAGNRRGGWYWKAYRTYQGMLYRAYLGKREDLTLARLNEIALTLSKRIHEQTKKTPVKASAISLTHHPGILDERLPPLLDTKLHPPRLPAGLVERTRLLARLDTCLEYKITMLVAPAGFGKSTLVNQWLAGHSTYLTSLAASWVSLDVSDNDLLSFWRSVMTVCQSLLGQERQAEVQAALAVLTTSFHSPLDAPPLDMALTCLLNALDDLSSGGLLVLDDYHAISEPLIHQTLAFFIDHLPTNVHVLLLSRTEPDFPLLRWRAKGELFELHGADLRFSLDETTAFLSQSLPVSLSEATLRRLDSSLEGWAAGLRLLSLILSTWHNDTAIERALHELGERANMRSQQVGTNVLHRSLFAYFVTEILDAQSEPMQHFLMQTSILSCLCAPLCDAVTEGNDSAKQLEAVERSGLFLEAMAGPGGWYNYHALFAEAMRREARQRLGEKILRTFALRASSWYEKEKMLPEAIEAAWLAQDMERVASLIEKVHEQNFDSPQTMLRWLEQLPEAVLRAHPLLCFLFATELRFPVKLWFAQEAALVAEAASLPSTERERVETLLSMAEEGWRSRGEYSWIGGIWAHRALSALLDQESFSSVVNFARQALVFLPPAGSLDRRLQMYRSSCLYFVGREKLDLGQVGEAQQMLLQAEEDNVPPGNKFLAVDIYLMIGKVYLIQGEQQLAQRYLRQALSGARELGDEKVIADAQLELTRLADNESRRMRGVGDADDSLIEPLTSQEERVLRLLAAGWSNQEIARELIISVNTVKYHIKHLYQKLGVSNRLQASEAARHLGIFSFHPRLSTGSERSWPS
jgi:LuxR family maltose regulon positive regulatory protein